MPSTAHRGPHPEPLGDRAGADQLDAGAHPGVAGQHRGVDVGRGRGRRGPAPGRRRRRRRRAGSRAGGTARSARRAPAPPNMPECTGWASSRTSTDDVDEPTQAGRERRDVDGGVGRVGDDDDVGAQQVDVARRAARGGSGDPISSSPSTKSVDADRRATAEGTQHRQVQQHPGLVVGRTAAVEAAASRSLGTNGGARPVLDRAGGLHVEVRVEQHRRCAVGRGPAGDDGRGAAGVGQPDVGSAGLLGPAPAPARRPPARRRRARRRRRSRGCGPAARGRHGLRPAAPGRLRPLRPQNSWLSR